MLIMLYKRLVQSRPTVADHKASHLSTLQLLFRLHPCHKVKLVTGLKIPQFVLVAGILR